MSTQRTQGCGTQGSGNPQVRQRPCKRTAGLERRDRPEDRDLELPEAAKDGTANAWGADGRRGCLGEGRRLSRRFLGATSGLRRVQSHLIIKNSLGLPWWRSG